MPRYLIRLPDDRASEPFDAVTDLAATDGGRGEEELIGTVEVPGDE